MPNWCCSLGNWRSRIEWPWFSLGWSFLSWICEAALASLARLLFSIDDADRIFGGGICCISSMISNSSWIGPVTLVMTGVLSVMLFGGMISDLLLFIGWCRLG